MPERLRPPDVADARDEPLVEERIADLATAVSAAQIDEHLVEVRRLGEDVRPQPPKRPRMQLEYPPAVEDRLALCSAQHEPRATARRLAARADAPAAGHAQVVSEQIAALEAQNEVLAHRFDPDEAAAVQATRVDSCLALRVRSLHLDALADEVLEMPRRAVERVTLWHVAPILAAASLTVPSMPDSAASRTRRDHALRIAATYPASAKVAAVVLGGSTARGDADRFSDLEIGVFWLDEPTDDERGAAIQRAGGDLEQLYPYDPAERAWFDDWKVGRRGGAPKTGISVDMVHVTTATVDWALEAALERHDPADAIQVLLAVLVDGVPLHGEDLLGRWRAAADYPPRLARAVVVAHAQIDHFWRFEAFRARDNPVLAYRAIVDVHERLLRTLLAVNRVYFFGFKSLNAVAARLDVAPPDLLGRIRRAYRGDLTEAERALAGLVEETYDIVERDVPGVDVERLRAIFRYRRPLWD